jgi:hypothetical protein
MVKINFAGVKPDCSLRWLSQKRANAVSSVRPGEPVVLFAKYDDLQYDPQAFWIREAYEPAIRRILRKLGAQQRLYEAPDHPGMRFPTVQTGRGVYESDHDWEPFSPVTPKRPAYFTYVDKEDNRSTLLKVSHNFTIETDAGLPNFGIGLEGVELGSAYRVKKTYKVESVVDPTLEFSVLVPWQPGDGQGSLQEYLATYLSDLARSLPDPTVSGGLLEEALYGLYGDYFLPEQPRAEIYFPDLSERSLNLPEGASATFDLSVRVFGPTAFLFAVQARDLADPENVAVSEISAVWFAEDGTAYQGF